MHARNARNERAEGLKTRRSRSAVSAFSPFVLSVLRRRCRCRARGATHPLARAVARDESAHVHLRDPRPHVTRHAPRPLRLPARPIPSERDFRPVSFVRSTMAAATTAASLAARRAARRAGRGAPRRARRAARSFVSARGASVPVGRPRAQDDGERPARQPGPRRVQRLAADRPRHGGLRQLVRRRQPQRAFDPHALAARRPRRPSGRPAARGQARELPRRVRRASQARVGEERRGVCAVPPAQRVPRCCGR